MKDTTKIPQKITGYKVKEMETLSTSPLMKLPRADVLRGKTVKIKPPIYPHGFYITINYNEEGKPVEVFIETKNSEVFTFVKTLSLTLTAVLRTGIDISFLLEEYKTILDPAMSFWYNKKSYGSLIALFAVTIQEHI